MLKRTSVVVSLLIGLLFSLLTAASTTIASASAPASASSQSATLATAKTLAVAGAAMAYDEQAALGCWDPYMWRGDFDLIGPAGNHRPDIGQVRLYMKEIPGKNPYCSITLSGDTTLNEGKTMTVKIGFYVEGSSTIYWPMAEGELFDQGWYSRQAGGVWGTVPDGKCLAIYGSVYWKGDLFKRTYRTGRCYG